MTQEQIYEHLKEIGLPVVYHHFEEGEAPVPPYLIYLFPGSDNFAADGRVYFKANELDVELYTDKKTPELEDKVEQLLDKMELVYKKNEDYIQSEKMYQVLYEMEV